MPGIKILLSCSSLVEHLHSKQKNNPKTCQILKFTSSSDCAASLYIMYVTTISLNTYQTLKKINYIWLISIILNQSTSMYRIFKLVGNMWQSV